MDWFVFLFYKNWELNVIYQKPKRENNPEVFLKLIKLCVTFWFINFLMIQRSICKTYNFDVYRWKNNIAPFLYIFNSTKQNSVFHLLLNFAVFLWANKRFTIKLTKNIWQTQIQLNLQTKTILPID